MSCGFPREAAPIHLGGRPRRQHTRTSPTVKQVYVFQQIRNLGSKGIDPQIKTKHF